MPDLGELTTAAKAYIYEMAKAVGEKPPEIDDNLLAKCVDELMDEECPECLDYAIEPTVTQYASDLCDRLEAAAKEADPEPTEEQKIAGNYRKGHVTMHGMDITIENAKGSWRRGKSKDGKEWATKMAHHYGYIKRTESEADGDHIDVFIGPNPESEVVFIVDQEKASGQFDEHKCMLGFSSIADAREGYLDCYSSGWQGLGEITPMLMEDFRKWVEKGDTGKRVA